MIRHFISCIRHIQNINTYDGSFNAIDLSGVMWDISEMRQSNGLVPRIDEIEVGRGRDGGVGRGGGG